MKSPIESAVSIGAGAGEGARPRLRAADPNDVVRPPAPAAHVDVNNRALSPAVGRLSLVLLPDLFNKRRSRVKIADVRSTRVKPQDLTVNNSVGGGSRYVIRFARAESAWPLRAR
ncbi:hypothetical protein EVAR_22739_1 [Eumeta japonica]|uniref:Uncharacterized protein n=1 Tax=Eumeta variegata TaxID=151549 RepID=A0A4C1UTK5_EUMVA|nr:hypothetical protein EVAR_22739_1 [Eumeta japonica]